MINILPYNHKKYIERIRALRVATVTMWAFILLAGVAMLLLIPLLVTINSRFAIANQQITQLEKSGIVISPVNVEAINTRAVALQNKLAATLPPSPIEYIAIIEALPRGGITLTGFSLSLNAGASVLEVAGVAATRDALQKFIATLQQHAQIATVESPVSNFVKSTNSTFTLTVTFK